MKNSYIWYTQRLKKETVNLILKQWFWNKKLFVSMRHTFCVILSRKNEQFWLISPFVIRRKNVSQKSVAGRSPHNSKTKWTTYVWKWQFALITESGPTDSALGYTSSSMLLRFLTFKLSKCSSNASAGWCICNKGVYPNFRCLSIMWMTA